MTSLAPVTYLKKNKIKIIILLSLVVFLFAAFYNGIVVKTYSIQTHKFSKDSHIQVAVITDLHSHIHGENQSKLVNRVKEHQPDLIVLVGDIADDVVPFEGTEILLQNLQGVAPMYYVTGNHEFWSGEVDHIKDQIAKLGVTVLENTKEEISIKGEKLTLCGVDDPYVVGYDDSFVWNSWEDMFQQFSTLDEIDGYKVLLTHRPEKIDIYENYAFDLILSGHSHGGQVRIPFLVNGLYAPDQGILPQYAGGKYEYNHITHIISRGVSFNPLLPRVFNPPELVIVEISGE